MVFAGDPFLIKLRAELFKDCRRVGVAVSGGADSVCLLHLMLELPGLDMTVLHLNHMARGAESDADAAFVRDLAARLGLPLEYREQRIPADDNFEQAARRVRKAFFLDCLKRLQLDCIATGHTLSDQAETVLFRFLRGAGTAGLAGILPVTAEGIVRPMLHLTRAEIVDWLRARGIAWREDSTNREVRFARNRIRHELLPALMRDWNPRLPEMLARTAALARDEEAYWETVVAPLAAERLVHRPPAVFLRADSLTDLPRAVARRLARRALAAAKGDLASIDLAHVEAFLHLAEAPSGAGRFQAPGLDVVRSFEWIRIAPPAAAGEANYRVRLEIPGRVTIPGTAASLVFELSQRPEREQVQEAEGKYRYNKVVSALDWGRIAGAPELRNWRPGDRYRPVGYPCDTKLKTLFQHARIPVWERRRWPVIVCGEEIAWAGRFGPAADCAATPDTRTVLKVRQIGSLSEF